MITVGFSSRAIAFASIMSLMALQGAAYAGDCNADIAALTQKRQAYIEKLNVLSKKAQGKLDPVASCPELRGLVASEGALLKYLQANQNWCNVPDDAVNNLKTADAKSQQFATQACNLAQQVKKQQQQQASGASGNALGVETQKLPAGPL